VKRSGARTDGASRRRWDRRSISSATAVIFGAAVVALVLGALSIRVVREYQRVVVFRLGRLCGERGPGLVLIMPLVERTRWVNLQIDTADIPPQDLITKDNVTIRVEAAVFFRVVDPVKAVVAIRDYKHGVMRIAQTTLRARSASTTSTTCSPTSPRSTTCSSRRSTRPRRRGALTWSRSRRRTSACPTR
jgi:hypothetical protein